MNTEISDNVAEAASEFGELERRNNLYIQDTLNDFGYKKLNEQAENVENSLENADPKTGFDELVLRDMRHNITTITEFADFLRRDSDLSVEEMFDLMHGEGAFDNLKDEANSYDDEANYRARELADGLTFDDVWTYDSEIKEISHDISGKIEEWAKDEGLMPQKFDFEIQMISPGRPQRANWRGSINQMNVPVENGVYVIRDGDKPVFDATNAIFAQFHELIGHGVHQQNSEDLEYPKFTDGPTYRPAANAHCEGIAQIREQLAEDFIQAERENLPVLDIGMQLRKKNRENKDSRELYTNLVGEMLGRDEISEEEAEDLAGEVYKPEIAEKALKSANYPTFKSFKEGSYPSGIKLMDNVDAEERPVKATTTGQWSAQIFSDVVEYLD